MKKEDFEFKEKSTDDEHEDYWFKVSGESQLELTREYDEYEMVSVVECVYSKDEDIVGIKRQFLFNYDVIIAYNPHLKQILNDLIDSLSS